MTTALNSGGHDVGCTADAANLPKSVTGVKPKSSRAQTNSPAPMAANGHVETAIQTFQIGPYKRLLVSAVTVPSGKPYASLRFFTSQDGVSFSPSRQGVMIPCVILDDVIAALREVRS
jgi:hypothetical protein